MKAKPRFLVCVQDGGYPESLEKRKLYRVLPDLVAAREGFVRIVDESGEDYLYPRALFASVRLTPPARKALLSTRA